MRGTFEETLNALLEEEAVRLCNAQRYERTPDPMDTRAGHYERGLHTQAEVAAQPNQRVHLAALGLAKIRSKLNPPKRPPAIRAKARANVVFPTPGTSSISRCPRAK